MNGPLFKLSRFCQGSWVAVSLGSLKVLSRCFASVFFTLYSKKQVGVRGGHLDLCLGETLWVLRVSPKNLSSTALFSHLRLRRWRLRLRLFDRLSDRRRRLDTLL